MHSCFYINLIVQRAKIYKYTFQKHSRSGIHYFLYSNTSDKLCICYTKTDWRLIFMQVSYFVHFPWVYPLKDKSLLKRDKRNNRNTFAKMITMQLYLHVNTSY